MPTVYQIVYITLTAAFLMLLSIKTGYRDKARDLADRYKVKNKFFGLVSEAIECDLCLSFWLSLVIAIFFMLITIDCSWVLVPILSTPLIRFLL